jgi:hypothetical protein
MKVVLLALGAGICFAQSTIQTQTNGFLAGGPVAANAGSGQPFAAKIVSGRPLTAEAVVETDQTLADGSHVVNRQTVTAARDSQGRTYREEVLATPATGSSALKAIVISDPVAKANYVLEPDHVAHKTPMLTVPDQAGATSVTTSGAPAGLSLQTFTTARGGGNGPVRASTPAAQPAQPAPGAVSMEQLGTQLIAGFEANGTRTTLTIPAGQVGNQNPLAIVTERWYSHDLEATVLAKRSDPRVGTSSYQFTTVHQIEPPASLFQIPSGYTVEEDGQ